MRGMAVCEVLSLYFCSFFFFRYTGQGEESKCVCNILATTLIRRGEKSCLEPKTLVHNFMGYFPFANKVTSSLDCFLWCVCVVWGIQNLGKRLFFFLSAGLRIWKLHMSVSSTLIIAPA